MPTLSDLVALVTGASRGAGRGIALELGAAGATVYVTGRSVEGGSTTDNVPGTIELTARDVPAGGVAVAVAPGLMRTEWVVDAFWRAGAQAALDGPGGPKETTAYLGRAIVALASDESVLAKSGQVLEAGTLATECAFTDVDESQPPPFRIPAPK